MTAGVAAVTGVAGNLIRRAALAANDGEGVEGGGRSALDEADAADDRLQGKSIGGDPADRLAPSALHPTAHEKLPAD